MILSFDICARAFRDELKLDQFLPLLVLLALVKIKFTDGEESEKHFDQIWQIRFISAVRQPSAITRIENI